MGPVSTDSDVRTRTDTKKNLSHCSAEAPVPHCLQRLIASLISHDVFTFVFCLLPGMYFFAGKNQPHCQLYIFI
jgi:hypothetical protein